MIDVENVRFTYDGERFAVDGVTAHIAAGEFVCILGGNGSGKSTLAKHMNALLVPDEGRVVVDGMPTSDNDALYDIRSTVGMVFQNPDDQLVASLVEDDVAFGPENLGVPTDGIVERVHDALKEVGLFGFERHETYALSGGQKQRVAIAGVLAMRPKVLVLDEATSMLDPRGRNGLMRVCRELHETGMTIVMITHFMEEAAQADRVIVLDSGRVAADGAPADVLVRTELLSGLNLEMPFAAKLSARLRAAGLDVQPCIEEEALVREVSAAVGAREAGQPNTPANVACEPAGPARPEREDVVVFDHVSFTYDTAALKRRKKSRTRRAGTKPAASSERAAWGNDPEAVWAIRDVSFRVKRGEFFGIAGHTGSGKSTLIQHMNAILHPTEGRVLVFGEDVSDKKRAAAVRAQVGVVFQYPEHQLFAATVYDDVAFGPRNLGLSEAEVDERVRESLARVALPFEDVREASPFELSGGQQRRVAFAGVLAMRPEVLVLDEPVAGLDPAARRDFLALISGLHESGLTVVMVSHNMDDLAACCDFMAVMKEGAVVQVGAPCDVFQDATGLKSLGLGLPAAQRTANALRDAGVPLPSGVLYSEKSLAEALARLAGPGMASGPSAASEG